MFNYLNLSFSLFSFLTIFLFVLFLAFPVTKRLFDFLGRKEESLYLTYIYSLVFSLLYFAFLGCLISLIPVQFKQLFSFVGIFSPVIFACINFAYFKKFVIQFYQSRESFFVKGFFLFSIAIIAMGHLNFKLPENLPDGAFVDKENVTSVRIQYLLGSYPADNSIPFVAEEYLARDLSFADNSPLLPGQVVTNRPIFVSLIVLPIRVFLQKPEKMNLLPKFTYVDTEWPDFRVFLREEILFSIFLGVAVFLNATLILGAGLLARLFTPSNQFFNFSVLLTFMTSPFFIIQTLFTWPKSFAAFFIILSTYIFLNNKKIFLSAFLLGLAYLCHPYAIAFFIIGLFFITLSNSRISEKLGLLFKYCTTFGATLLPWLIWSYLIIGINSDLIAQNFNLRGNVFRLIFMRINNIFHALIPSYLGNYDLNLKHLFSYSAHSLAGAIGVIIYIASITIAICNGLKWFKDKKNILLISDHNFFVFKNMIIYFLISNILLGSIYAMPVRVLEHGWEALATALLVLMNFIFYQKETKFNKFVFVQIFINILFFAVYLKSTLNGLH